MTELKITTKIAHYHDIGTPQIYHGCGLVRQENGLMKLLTWKMVGAAEVQHTYHIENFVILRDIKIATSDI